MKRTWVVLVHGEPGAGKSTLASAMGERLGLPVFDRDELKDQMFDALGWSDRAWSTKVGAASWELLGYTIERLVREGVSLIAETNFRPGTPMIDRLRRMCEETGTRAVEVFVTASPEVLWTRYQDRRVRGDRHPGHAGFETREAYVSALAARPHGPLGLDPHPILLDTSRHWPEPGDVARQVARRLDGAEAVAPLFGSHEWSGDPPHQERTGHFEEG